MTSPSPPPPSNTPTTLHLLSIPPPSSQQQSISPPKKTQPLPWTHQETVNLIQSYQEKWYSLKKGQLKASQWEEVSITVAARCGFDDPSKTSTQCRHKMEKLRKRYRAERVKPYPNCWQFFQLMDNLERGPFPLVAVAQPVSSVKMQPQVQVQTQHQLSSSTSFNHFNHNNDSESDRIDVKNNKSKSINNILRGGMEGVYRSNDYDGSSIYGGNSRRIPIFGGNERGMMPKMVRESSMLNSRKRRGYYEHSDDEDMDVDVDGEGEGDDDKGVGDGGKELAAEIRGFAERFMRVEKMKIDMMKETERYQMEMEKRRMEMILDSQRKIVDSIGSAFRAHKKLNNGQEV